MIEFIKVCGIAGVLILILTAILLFVYSFTAALCKSRKPFAILAVVAFVPFLLGLLGTAAGYSKIRKSHEIVEPPEMAFIQHGRAEARYTAYLGAGCTGLLMVMVGIGAASKRKAAEQRAVE